MATTSASSDSGVGLVLHQLPVVTLAPPPSIALDRPPAAAKPAPPTLAELVAAHAHDVRRLDVQTACLAKVVQHEAGNQPLEGQLAVAEVVMNRVRSHRFPRTPCAVVSQPGQFQDIAGFVPRTSSPRWRTVVAVARIARDGEGPPVVRGALFFHASYARADWSHRRVRIASIGDQVFYR